MSHLKIGYTLGDLGGIGPEIFAKFSESTIAREIEPILIDDPSAADFHRQNIGLGKASAEAGKHSYQTLQKAAQMANEKQIDFLITGPVSKESLRLAGYKFSGQTELLASFQGLNSLEVEMLFVLDEFRVLLATRHEALADVPQTLKHRLRKAISKGITAMQNIFQINSPKIAVAALNPHAGEHGIMGMEEDLYIRPQIQEAQAKFSGQAEISGPLAADYIFAKAARDYLSGQRLSHDLYIAAYHDQVLPLIKGIGGYKALNITIGLPYLRISVDHGTAFDIAGQGIADPSGLIACTEFCLSTCLIRFT
jgi:4-hydroxythreonine-4-phosphate dehydrogenase